jgi:hypothetical protein
MVSFRPCIRTRATSIAATAKSSSALSTAISTVAVCKGDNGHWQPNYPNVGGNIVAAFISSLYYPSSDQHSAQVTVDNTLISVATVAFGTLFHEFLLHRFTHGKPTQP